MPSPTVEVLIRAVGHEAVKAQIAGLKGQAQAATGAQTGLAGSSRTVTTSIQAQNRATAQAATGLGALKISLGGAEAASHKLAVAQGRIQAAEAAGLVTKARALQLSAAATAHFNTEAIAARSLTGSLAGLTAAQGRVATAGAGLLRVMGSLGIVIGATVFIGAIRSASEYADELGKVARATGLTVEGLEGLRRAAAAPGMSAERNDRCQPEQARCDHDRPRTAYARPAAAAAADCRCR